MIVFRRKLSENVKKCSSIYDRAMNRLPLKFPLDSQPFLLWGLQPMLNLFVEKFTISALLYKQLYTCRHTRHHIVCWNNYVQKVGLLCKNGCIKIFTSAQRKSTKTTLLSETLSRARQSPLSCPNQHLRPYCGNHTSCKSAKRPSPARSDTCS